MNTSANSRESMELELRQYITNHEFLYIEISNYTYLINVYELFINNTMFEPSEIIDYIYIGVYYKIQKNYEKIIKY